MVDTVKRDDGRYWDSSSIVHNGRKLSDILNAEHQVNDIFLSFTDENPSKRFGGKWALIAIGRTLVGVDPNDKDFEKPFKTGGSKFLQRHFHNLCNPDTGNHITLGNSVWGWSDGVVPKDGTNAGTHLATDNVGEGNSGNLQPYITCYIWYRVS